jgi:hypothetical protein
MRERQFRAAFSPARTVAIAKAIVTDKIKAEGHRAGQAFLAELRRAKTVDDVRSLYPRNFEASAWGALFSMNDLQHLQSSWPPAQASRLAWIVIDSTEVLH